MLKLNFTKRFFNNWNLKLTNGCFQIFKALKKFIINLIYVYVLCFYYIKYEICTLILNICIKKNEINFLKITLILNVYKK